VSPVELLPPHEATPSNPKWHELRRQGISASEIAAVLGISPWQSPFSCYWQKVEGWQGEDNAEMSAGRRAEGVIADWFADECDPHESLAVRSAGLYASKDRPWQLATPDRLIWSEWEMQYGTHGPLGRKLLALLECKYLIGGWDGWGEPDTDDIPVHYRAQALWQLDVMEVDEVFVAAWHGAEFRCYRVRRDEKDLRVMRTAGREFMDRLAAGDPPPIDDHTATIATLKQRHPSLEDREVLAPVELAEAYRRARALKARAEKALDGFEARIRDLLGDANRLTCNGHLVASRSVYERKPYEVGAVTIDKLNPGRAASYLTPKGAKR
jgi:putative phage-type endonuclease